MDAPLRNKEPPIGQQATISRSKEDRWERLLRAEKCVGYRRKMGRATMFSKDGYGWSANRIEHDTRLPEASFGGCSLKVFHGDIVEMPYRYDSQEHRKLVVLVLRSGEEFLFDPQSGEVDALAALWSPPSTAFAHGCLGSVWLSTELRQRSLAVLNALHAEKKPGIEMVAYVAAVILFGVLAAGLLQWGLLEEVGPLTSVLGGFTTVMVLLARWRQSNPHLFSRRWAMSMTWRVAIFCGAVSLLMATLLNYSVPRLIGIGLTGLLCSGLIWLLSVDLVTWRTGGYEREPGSSRRAGSRWD